MTHGYPIDEISHLNITKEKKTKENTKSMSYAHGFDEFWKEYPRKVQKKKALAAWEKVMRSEKITTSQIMHSLAAWKLSDQWTKDGGQFIPHPTTWLNGERWEDEVGVPAITHLADQF